MNRRLVLIIALTLLVGMLSVASNVQRAKASGTIYIRADGSIDPPDAPISTVDNVTYTLTGNIISDAHGIFLQRSNMTMDGAGFTLLGTRNGAGIYMNGMSNVTVIDTTVNNFTFGFSLGDSFYNNIIANNITNNQYAINDDGSWFYPSNNNITANNITANNEGINLSNSSNNTITGNNITAGFDVAILLWFSSNYNTISQNNIANNGKGIWLSESSNNNIFNNNFVNNTQQVYVEKSGYTSFWNNSYPSGGNYWSDYSGLDLYSGSYQNEPGSDGLGDEPYIVDVDNIDNYPLMRPWVPFEGQVIYVRADGNVDPSGAPLQRKGDSYTFTSNITSNSDGIVIERGNIIIDGAGYTVTESGSGNGITLTDRSNVTVGNMTIKNFAYGIGLYSSSNNILSGNNITNNYVGIYLHASSNNNIANNTVTNNRDFGIWLRESSVNRISGNNITNNRDGIDLSGSSNNTISGNLFMRDGLSVWDSYGNAVVDNFVNGKPLVYLEDVSHQSVGDAGQVILVNCQHITVENLNPSNTNVGVQLWQTNNTIIQGNNITANNEHGIWLYESSNNSVIGNNVTNNGYGIYLYKSSNNSVSGNNVTNNDYSGIVLPGPSNNNSILGNNVTANYYHGISLSWSSNNNSILGNNVTANGYNGIDLSWFSNDNSVHGNNVANNGSGIYLDNSSNSSISGNNITNNEYGILLSYSSDNSISGNNITKNNRDGISLQTSHKSSISENNIKANSVDGIHLDLSLNNTMSDNNVANNGNGISLIDSFNNTLSCNNVTTSDGDGIVIYSSYNTLSGNDITANKGYGVGLYSFSYDNILFDNNIARNRDGILLDSSTGNNVLSGNNVTANDEYGIRLYSSSNNTLSGNNITANKMFGVWLYSSSHDNVFYHNNFISNSQHVIQLSIYANSWDNGFEGNYWSNYTGVDLDHDGIGDSAHVIDTNNTDHYPLMGMFSDFNATSELHVQPISNSTITDFRFDGAAIHFNVSGENGTAGFCRICVPKELMDQPYHVFVNGTEIQHTLLPCSNGTHSYLYFSYTHSTEEVIIIPELPSFLVLPLFMLFTMLAVVFIQRRIPSKQENDG